MKAQAWALSWPDWKQGKSSEENHLGVSQNGGTQKGMVFVTENPTLNGWFGGNPISGNLRLASFLHCSVGGHGALCSFPFRGFVVSELNAVSRLTSQKRCWPYLAQSCWVAARKPPTPQRHDKAAHWGGFWYPESEHELAVTPDFLSLYVLKLPARRDKHGRS